MKKQRNEPVIDFTDVVFNQKRSLWQKFKSLIRRMFLECCDD